MLQKAPRPSLSKPMKASKDRLRSRTRQNQSFEPRFLLKIKTQTILNEAQSFLFRKETLEKNLVKILHFKSFSASYEMKIDDEKNFLKLEL